MDRGIFIAAHQASTMMDRQAMIAKNLANVATPGFKKQFQQVQTWTPGVQSKVSSRAWGVLTNPGLDLKEAPLMQTGNPMHVAMGSKEYLSVRSPAGDLFTRRGDIEINAQGQLALSSGELVLNNDAEPFTVPAGFSIQFGSNGLVTAVSPENPENVVVLGNLGIFTQERENISLHDSGFLSINNPQPKEVPGLTLGALESSNVSSAQMMAEMIEGARLFDMSTKLISSFETMDKRGSDLLGTFR